jgi:hypothetical protein
MNRGMCLLLFMMPLRMSDSADCYSGTLTTPYGWMRGFVASQHFDRFSAGAQFNRHPPF